MRVPLAVPNLSDLERRYLLQAFDSTWLTSSGSFNSRVENEQFERFSGKPYNLLCSNGTVALHLACMAIGLQPEDEVIVPTLTYIASVNAVAYTQAKPVFVDVSPKSWVTTLELLEGAVTSNTKAIILVHLYGHSVDTIGIKEFAGRRGIFIIEDVAEAIGGKNRGILNGSAADISTFSFYGNKLVTSGEGGAVSTSSQELYEKMRLLRDQGMDSSRRYYFPVIGYNYRLTNLQAAILSAQLERFDEIRQIRTEQAQEYNRMIENLESIETQPIQDWCEWSPWLYSILLESVDKRRLIVQELRNAGIETRPFFIPIHTLPPYLGSETKRSLDCSVDLSNRGMNLPLGHHVNSSIIQEIYSVLEKLT